jgi:hypothetical protein
MSKDDDRMNKMKEKAKENLYPKKKHKQKI